MIYNRSEDALAVNLNAPTVLIHSTKLLSRISSSSNIGLPALWQPHKPAITMHLFAGILNMHASFSHSPEWGITINSFWHGHRSALQDGAMPSV